MNGRELYEHLKTAIKTFGLAFHEMDQVKILLLPNQIRFIYENKEFNVYVN